MSIVQLTILNPVHQATFVGPARANIAFRGEVIADETTPVPLFFDWYSSLHTPPDAATITLNQSTDNPLSFQRSLTVGSHVITLAAKDRPGNTLADLQAVNVAGMAGGPEVAEHPCIIHILIANILSPTNNARLSPASGALVAEAPAQWGRERAGSPGVYEPNPDYLETINQIQYVWGFSSQVNPSRPPIEIRPTPEQLIFEITRRGDRDVPSVRYSGPFPNGLSPGPYALTLRVEDRENPAIGHQVAIALTVT